MSGDDHVGTVRKAAINAMDHLRAARVFDPSINELKTLVMPCNSTLSCVSTVTVKWADMRFIISVEHHSRPDAEGAVAAALEFNYNTLASECWASKTSAQLSRYLIRLSQEDLTGLGLGIRAVQLPSISCIVIHDPDNGRFMKYIPDEGQQSMNLLLSIRYCLRCDCELLVNMRFYV